MGLRCLRNVGIAIVGAATLLGTLSAAPNTAPQSAQGKIFGSRFKPSRFEAILLNRASISTPRGKEFAETVHFRISEGSDAYMPDKEVVLMLQLPSGTRLSGLKWHQRATKFGTEEHSKQFYPKGNSLGWGVIGVNYSINSAERGKSRLETSQTVGCNLAFGKQQGNKVAGQIELWVDGGKATLNGSFVAVVTKY